MKKLYELFVYSTWHGVYSETSVLHIGYQQCKSYHDDLIWYSKPISLDEADYIYEKVKHYDHLNNSYESEVKSIISEYILNYGNKG